MAFDGYGLRTELALAVMRGRVVDRGDCLVVETPDAPGRVFTNLLVLPAPPRADDIARWTERFAAELPGRGHLALRWANQLGPDAELRAAGFDVHVLRTLLADDVTAPPATLEVRELRGDELPAAADIAFAVGERHDEPYRSALQERARWLAELVARGTAKFWGAFDGGLVASVGLVELGDLGRFQDVNTATAHQRRGLAGALLATAARDARTRGVERFVILALDDGSARKLYERVGFAALEPVVTAWKFTSAATGPVSVRSSR